MPDPVVSLPPNLSGPELKTLAENCARTASDEGAWPQKIIFDFSSLKFIRPTGIVFLDNLVNWLNHRGCKVWFQNHQKATDALRFLDDTQFFYQHLNECVWSNARVRPSTFQLERVRHADSSARMEFAFLPWLANRFETSVHANGLLELRSSIIEIFNNIKDHTAFDIGGICAQHFPATGEIEIALADIGQGIPNSVRQTVPTLTDDAQATQQAFVEGFTTMGAPNNMGAGLALLRDRCVGLNRGKLFVYSGYCQAFFWPNGSQICSNFENKAEFSPGTTIGIHITRSNLDLTEAMAHETDWDF